MRSILIVATLLFAGVICPGQAQVVRQVTDLFDFDLQRPRLTDDGAWIYAVTSDDLTGENPQRRLQVFRWSTATGQVEQVTHLDTGLFRRSIGLTAAAISDDGARLAFASTGDPIGGNPDGSVELFAMNADGTGMIQLTDGSGDWAINRIEMSANGGRVVFGSDFDYLGANPTHETRIFIVDGDGTNLRQLTSMFSYFPSISDDGERVAFVNATEIGGIRADGTGLRQLTSWSSTFPVISGNGQTVVFLGTGTLPNESPGWCFGGTQVGAVDWDGTDPIKLTGLCAGDAAAASAAFLDVTDDGQAVFYSGGPGTLSGPLGRIGRDGSGETSLVGGPDWSGVVCDRIAVSGNGASLAGRCEGNTFGGSNPDRGMELLTLDANGGSLTQYTDATAGGDNGGAFISGDGTQVVFRSDADLLTGGATSGLGLYRTALDGDDLRRLVDFDVGEGLADIATNVDGSIAVYSVDVPFTERGIIEAVDAQTGVVTVLADDPSRNFRRSTIDGAGLNVVCEDVWSGNLFRVGTDGAGLATLTAGWAPALADEGTVVFLRGADLYRIDLDGSAETLLATEATSPSVSRDGTTAVFIGQGDPVGQNADGSDEIFEVDTATLALRQLTDNTEASIEGARVSGDGSTVYFVERFAGTSDRALSRLDTATRARQRVEGLQPCSPATTTWPVVSDDGGDRAVFQSTSDCAGRNGDSNSEVFLVDLDATPALFADLSQPTRWRWDVQAGALSYDLIRGELAQIVDVAGGIDLGTVVCVDGASVDNTTLGADDAALPAPGAVFFYLVRGRPTGDYGAGSNGHSRAPTAGDCP